MREELEALEALNAGRLAAQAGSPSRCDGEMMVPALSLCRRAVEMLEAVDARAAADQEHGDAKIAALRAEVEGLEGDKKALNALVLGLRRAAGGEHAIADKMASRRVSEALAERDALRARVAELEGLLTIRNADLEGRLHALAEGDDG